MPENIKCTLVRSYFLFIYVEENNLVENELISEAFSKTTDKSTIEMLDFLLGLQTRLDNCKGIIEVRVEFIFKNVWK